MTQAATYFGNGWFLVNMAVLTAALVDAAPHFRRITRPAAILSLALWPIVLVLGRMIGLS